jgi:hypothetical protein
MPAGCQLHSFGKYNAGHPNRHGQQNFETFQFETLIMAPTDRQVYLGRGVGKMFKPSINSIIETCHTVNRDINKIFKFSSCIRIVNQGASAERKAGVFSH